MHTLPLQINFVLLATCQTTASALWVAALLLSCSTRDRDWNSAETYELRSTFRFSGV